jgi:hypothetical protein
LKLPVISGKEALSSYFEIKLSAQEIIKYFPFNYNIYVPNHAHEKTALIKIQAACPGDKT